MGVKKNTKPSKALSAAYCKRAANILDGMTVPPRSKSQRSALTQARYNELRSASVAEDGAAVLTPSRKSH